MRSTALLLVVLAGCGEEADQPGQVRQALSSGVVISEIYGGGGSTGAPFDSDFVELFNRGSSTVTIDGWTLQVATETSSTWNAVALSGSIDAGQSYLVRMGAAGITGAPFSADTTGAAPLGFTAGKVLLASSTTLMNGACPSGPLVVDLVGYGAAATCFERARAGSPSATLSLQRREDGCVERDDNANDFVLASPTPTPSTEQPRVCSPDAGAPPPIDAGVIEPSNCLEISTFPSVATRGGYDRGRDRSFARLYTQEPTRSDGGMQMVSLEAAFFSGLSLPARRTFTLDGGVDSESCELCVTFGRRCTRSACSEEFFIESGEVFVALADRTDAGHFVGSITNARLVRWDFSNHRAVPGGQCVAIPSLSVDVWWPTPTVDAGVDGGAEGDAGVGADGGDEVPLPGKGCSCGSTDGIATLVLAVLLLSRLRLVR